MKNLLINAITLLVATMLIAVMPTEREAVIYEDTVRLHILACSDSEEDQRIKLDLRDRILEKYADELSKSGSADDAKERIYALLGNIEYDANRWMREMGADYKVKASLGNEWYETRDYGEFSLPAGYYTSLILKIGNGEGKNWWCVMYPPLCLELATESAPADDMVIDYTKEEINLISSGKYNIKFKILEEFSRVFSKNG